MVTPTGVNQFAGKIAEQGLKEGADKPQEANAGDQARFQDALQKGRQNDPGEQGVQQATPARAESVDSPRPERPDPPGDSILEGMDKMRTEVKGMADRIQSTDELSSMSPQELLKTQLQVSRVMFNEQLVGQATGKLEQDSDTLLKSN